MKRNKIDLHSWRMEEKIKRINEFNDRRNELMKGQSQTHPEWFAKWEANELEKRHQFEKQIERSIP